MSAERDLAPGLYLVGSPIGNLEDITLRALRVLKQADLIACEDTRQTQKLLNHFGIEKPTLSYHQHNEARRAQELLDKLTAGGRIALVSDAGMPGIADPVFRLLSLALERGVPVVPVPGPTAFVTALVSSGLPVESFSFGGFLPAKSGSRRRALERVRQSPHTQIFYEAPHRILEALEAIAETFGPEQRVVVARELTKIHEEFLRGTVAEVLAMVKSRGELKGEMVLLIGPPEQQVSHTVLVSVRDRIDELIRKEKLDAKVALKKVAKERGISKSEAYREWQASKAGSPKPGVASK